MTKFKAAQMLATAAKALAKTDAKIAELNARREPELALVIFLREMAKGETAVPPKPNHGRGTVEEQLAAGRKIVVEEA
jgi:hypothetical protein